MPYLTEERKAEIDAGARPEVGGELNYAVTKLLVQFLQDNGPVNYALLNEVVGAVDGAKAEFQRRVVAPYEDTKIEQNGDVYPAFL